MGNLSFLTEVTKQWKEASDVSIWVWLHYEDLNTRLTNTKILKFGLSDHCTVERRRKFLGVKFSNMIG